MKKFKLILLTLSIPILMVSCKKSHSRNCETATLYYTPGCATIKGYVTLDNGKINKTFQHAIDPKYQGTGVRVCITYTVSANQVLTADCMTAQVITLTSIESE